MSRLAAILPALITIVSCDQSTPSSALPATAFGTATLSGRVHFVGVPPERKMIDTSACQCGSKAQQEETIVVDGAGGLRDVVVYLKDPVPSDGSTMPAAVLDQVDCCYVPHVLAVQVAQPLEIRTSDPFLHNVHWTSGAGGDVNFGMSHPGESKTVTFDRPGFVQMNCNVHAWMSASVAVIANPFFAVTNADGRFKIDRIPAGKHTLVAWHPLLGERTAFVDVAADGVTQTSIDFGPPALK